ncbi:MAG: hypothetical protein EYC68_19990 [Chloroflexota bacterium]|nr:MAG: hypothetical protein EYC68_19990 [Chloroflexota bacterium]
MKTQTISLQPLGYEAFDTLKAESEADWLDAVLYEPPDLARMMTMRTCLVIGARGSGKTTLRLALLKKCKGLGTNAPLVVEWRPELPGTELTETEIVRAYLEQVIEACSVAILHYIAVNHALFERAPLHIRETLAAILQHFLPGDRELHLSQVEADASEAGIAVARDALTRQPRSLLKSDASANTLIRMLANCAKVIGVSRIWIITDQLEEWLDFEMQGMAESLHSLTKALAVFETAGFEFKLIAPSEFEPYLMKPSALTIRRINGFPLQWNEEQLRAIVERRFAAAMGKKEFHLNQLAPPKIVMDYLLEYGGKTPRGWLELVQPLAQAYLEQEVKRPLTTQVLETLRRENPLPLRRDPRTREFMLHYKPLKLAGQTSKMLSLLYERRECTRAELWYLALRGFDTVPQHDSDPHWEKPDLWRGTFDTTLYRLRQLVEPNPDAPVYILSEGIGRIVLKHAL